MRIENMLKHLTHKKFLKAHFKMVTKGNKGIKPLAMLQSEIVINILPLKFEMCVLEHLKAL